MFVALSDGPAARHLALERRRAGAELYTSALASFLCASSRHPNSSSRSTSQVLRTTSLTTHPHPRRGRAPRLGQSPRPSVVVSIPLPQPADSALCGVAACAAPGAECCGLGGCLGCCLGSGASSFGARFREEAQGERGCRGGCGRWRRGRRRPRGHACGRHMFGSG